MNENEKRGLSAVAPLAGVSPPPSGITAGGGKNGRPIAQANIQLESPEFDPKNLPEWAEEFAEFLLLTGQSHVDVATKCSLLKRSCKKKFLHEQVKQIVKTCSTWAEVLQRLEKTFPVFETDLSVRTQIEELPMLPEFPSAARVSEYVCDLEYLFSRMNVGSYGATEPHLWLMSKISQRTWDDCRATSERKSRTHWYNDLVDLLIELAPDRENDSHMEKFLKKHLGRGGTPTPERGEGKGLKNPTYANQGGGKGRHNLRAMNEVKPDAGTPPLFYCKPVNDKGGDLAIQASRLFLELFPSKEALSPCGRFSGSPSAGGGVAAGADERPWGLGVHLCHPPCHLLCHLYPHSGGFWWLFGSSGVQPPAACVYHSRVSLCDIGPRSDDVCHKSYR